jgi:hypothetical protein
LGTARSYIALHPEIVDHFRAIKRDANAVILSIGAADRIIET